MRRGFKADAERRAAAARQSLDLAPTARLDPWDYAASLGILVFGANELELAPTDACQLLERDPDSWSGMTLAEDGVHVIVINSAHGQARQCSTLMHEIAHVLLDHLPARVEVSKSGIILLSDYSDEQEQEADWLGAALLLPEAALLNYRSRGTSVSEIAEIYGVSEELCTWRCRMTGVEKRIAFRNRNRR